jgi:hypothetical protein
VQEQARAQFYKFYKFRQNNSPRFGFQRRFLPSNPYIFL